MIRDILFAATGTPGDAAALSAAVALSSRFDAHLTALEVVGLPVPAGYPWGLTPDPAMLPLYTDLRGAGERSAAWLRERLGKEAISWQVDVTETMLTDPSRIASLYAHRSDLVVLAAPGQLPDDARIVHGFFAGVLFESGRPVMLVPGDLATYPPSGKAVVAWRSTREAARALHDALPLLALASSVDVATVAEEDDKPQGEPDRAADIAAHLALHGLEANAVSLALAGGTVAGALLRHAIRSDAQLLVAGGYGHSRLREWVLGGTTRELAYSVRLPIVFSR